ncbi:hypothetical protein A0H76_1632 [Hepatospora eriocheir]|uniref:Uncharacterized protein n=1 Tax=Hepatospora eriocheir TaxID=1081669 RepID=A0A1X0QKL4_9MICR|nr:hypothetical protein A0H76_1632 [Hepatospora eriocheir]
MIDRETEDIYEGVYNINDYKEDEIEDKVSSLDRLNKLVTTTTGGFGSLINIFYHLTKIIILIEKSYNHYY